MLDIRARDSAGRWLNIQMQVSVFSGLVERPVYYACSVYVDQSVSGQSYADLKPAISICLLPKELFRGSRQAHHRFQLMDHESGRELEWALQGAREEGLKKGREEGLETGSLAGRIQILQQLLGESESSIEELRDLPTDELSTRLADLQQRLRSRGD